MYSKLRGARKIKPKKEEVQPGQETVQETKVVDTIVEDAFQQQGKRVLDNLFAHPYFVIGSVLAVVVLVVISLGISSFVKNAKSEKSLLYAHALKVWSAEVGAEGEFKTENEKMRKSLEEFKKVSDKLSGSFAASAAQMYMAKAHYRLNDLGAASELFKKLQKDSNLSMEMKFGAFEGEAFTQFDRGDYAMAIEVWERFLKESNAPIYKDFAIYYIGTTYEKMNKQDKALEYFKKLKAEYPESSLISKIADKLPKEELKPAPQPEKKG